MIVVLPPTSGERKIFYPIVHYLTLCFLVTAIYIMLSFSSICSLNLRIKSKVVEICYYLINVVFFHIVLAGNMILLISECHLTIIP